MSEGSVVLIFCPMSTSAGLPAEGVRGVALLLEDCGDLILLVSYCLQKSFQVLCIVDLVRTVT